MKSSGFTKGRGNIEKQKLLISNTLVYQAKHLCIIVPAPLILYMVPYLHQLSAVEYSSVENTLFWCYLEQVFKVFDANLAS